MVENRLESKSASNSTLSNDRECQHTMVGEPWSVFSRRQKYLIVGLAAVAGFFSPLSSSIYFPAIETLAYDFNKSIGDINMTVTVYMILQGLVPALFTDLAQNIGKRPVYLITFAIYIAANIGLALQNSYGALMGLRCLQSSGSSVTAALAISSASDVAKGSERGHYVGITVGGLLIGMSVSVTWNVLTITAPSIGPVIGGLLAGTLGWRAIFWFLAILAGVVILIYFTFGLESARSIVGNGSIPPPKLNQSVVQLLKPQPSQWTNKRRWQIPNPARSFAMFLEKDLVCILLYSGIINAAMYQIAASTVVIFQEIYGYNDIIIGVCYLPLGLGAMLGSIGGGKVLDIVLKRYARVYNTDIDSGPNDSFPWARARLTVLIPCATIAGVFAICYGWVVQAKTSIAAPLVFQFCFSAFAAIGFNAAGVMLVDSYPSKSATASAANNISRCWIGAGATAVIQPMLDAMGRGWCFTFVGLVVIAGLLMLLPVWMYGQQWREKRVERENE